MAQPDFMPDEDVTDGDGAIVPFVPQPPAVVKRKTKLREKAFIPSLTIRTETGDRFQVPVDAEANRAASQLMAARLRDVLDFNLRAMKDAKIPLEPAQIKDLAAAIQKVEEINRAAYAPLPSLLPTHTEPMTPTSDMGRLLAGAVEAAAKGGAQGATSSFDEQLSKIKQLGRKALKVVEAEVTIQK